MAFRWVMLGLALTMTWSTHSAKDDDTFGIFEGSRPGPGKMESWIRTISRDRDRCHTFLDSAPAHSSWIVRRFAVEVVLFLADADTTNRWLSSRTSLTEPNWKVRLAEVQLVVLPGFPRVMEYLDRSLGDPVLDVRRRAAALIRRVPGLTTEEKTARLIRVFSEVDPYIRNLAALALLDLPPADENVLAELVQWGRSDAASFSVRQKVRRLSVRNTFPREVIRPDEGHDVAWWRFLASEWRQKSSPTAVLAEWEAFRDEGLIDEDISHYLAANFGASAEILQEFCQEHQDDPAAELLNLIRGSDELLLKRVTYQVVFARLGRRVVLDSVLDFFDLVDDAAARMFLEKHLRGGTRDVDLERCFRLWVVRFGADPRSRDFAYEMFYSANTSVAKAAGIYLYRRNEADDHDRLLAHLAASVENSPERVIEWIRQVPLSAGRSDGLVEAMIRSSSGHLRTLALQFLFSADASKTREILTRVDRSGWEDDEIIRVESWLARHGDEAFRQEAAHRLASGIVSQRDGADLSVFVPGDERAIAESLLARLEGGLYLRAAFASFHRAAARVAKAETLVPIVRSGLRIVFANDAFIDRRPDGQVLANLLQDAEYKSLASDIAAWASAGRVIGGPLALAAALPLIEPGEVFDGLKQIVIDRLEGRLDIWNVRDDLAHLEKLSPETASNILKINLQRTFSRLLNSPGEAKSRIGAEWSAWLSAAAVLQDPIHKKIRDDFVREAQQLAAAWDERGDSKNARVLLELLLGTLSEDDEIDVSTWFLKEGWLDRPSLFTLELARFAALHGTLRSSASGLGPFREFENHLLNSLEELDRRGVPLEARVVESLAFSKLHSAPQTEFSCVHRWLELSERCLPKSDSAGSGLPSEFLFLGGARDTFENDRSYRLMRNYVSWKAGVSTPIETLRPEDVEIDGVLLFLADGSLPVDLADSLIEAVDHYHAHDESWLIGRVAAEEKAGRSRRVFEWAPHAARRLELTGRRSAGDVWSAAVRAAAALGKVEEAELWRRAAERCR